MKLVLADFERTFESPVEVEAVIAQINEWLDDTYYYEGLRVDGMLVPEQPEDYLASRVDSVERVDVLVKEAAVFIPELLASGEGYVRHALPLVDPLIVSFEDDAVSGEQWSDLSDLFGGVQWLLSMTDVVEASIVNVPDWQDVVEQKQAVETALQQFEEALEQQATPVLEQFLREAIVPFFGMVEEVIGRAFEETLQRPTVQ